MKALVHYPYPTAGPNAIFWTVNDRLNEYVPDPEADGIRFARYVVAKQPVDTFDKTIMLLGERNPSPHVWSVVEVEDPRAWLDQEIAPPTLTIADTSTEGSPTPLPS